MISLSLGNVPTVTNGALGGVPTLTRGALGHSPSECGGINSFTADFGTDPNDPQRIAYAAQVYQQAFGVTPPERVLAAVRQQGFCSQASVAQQVKSMPPTPAERTALAAASLPGANPAALVAPPSAVPPWLIPAAIVGLAVLGAVAYGLKKKKRG